MTTALTLAVGIGLVTAMFSVVQGVLLRPLPIQDQERVVLLEKTTPGDGAVAPFAFADLEALRESTRTLEAVAGVQYDGAWPYGVRDGDQLFVITGALVSSEFFSTLGARPALGRLFRPDDGEARADQAVVISHAFWRRHYGSRPDVVDRTFEFVESGDRVRIVGVAPEGFSYPRGAEMWVSLPRVRELMEARMAPFSVVGRLARGTSPAQAAAEVEGFLRRREETVYRPHEPRGHRVAATPFFEAVVGELRPALSVLSIAVTLLLLLVASNVANLLLARATSRSAETAVRLAVGARRGDAARPLVLEGLLLAAAAAAAGVFVAWGAVRAIVALAPPELPRLDEVGVDLRTLAFALAASVVTATLAMVAPLLWLARSDLQSLLRLGPGGGMQSRSARWGDRSLVVWQAAMAMLVIAGAGLLGRTLWNLQRADMAFAGEELVVANLSLPQARYASPEARLRFFEEVSERLSARSEVAAATPVQVPPFTGEGGWNSLYSLEGQTPAEAAGNPTLNVEGVAPGHFEAVGTPVLRGRGFTSADRSEAVPVAVVSESLAARAWPGEDPLGRRIRLGAPESSLPMRTVVGLVPDTRYRDLAAVQPTVYVPFRQSHYAPRRLLVRIAGDTGDPGGAYSAVRAAAREADPEAQVVEMAPVRALMREPLARPRFNLLLMSVFAAVSLALAAVGLYGVMITWVLQRSRELALRLALGARPGDVRRMVLGRGLALVAIGVAAGLAVALPGGRVLSSVLYGVSAHDPATLVSGVALMLAVGLVACYRPVRRALRVDPAAALSDASLGEAHTGRGRRDS